MSVEATPLRVEIAGRAGQQPYAVDYGDEPGHGASARPKRRSPTGTSRSDGAPQFGSAGCDPRLRRRRLGPVRTAGVRARTGQAGHRSLHRHGAGRRRSPAAIAPVCCSSSFRGSCGEAEKARQIIFRSRIATLIYVHVGQPAPAVELTNLQIRGDGGRGHADRRRAEEHQPPFRPHEGHARVLRRHRRSPSRSLPVPDVPVLPESEREVAIIATDAKQPLVSGDLQGRTEARCRDARASRRRNDHEGRKIDHAPAPSGTGGMRAGARCCLRAAGRTAERRPGHRSRPRAHRRHEPHRRSAGLRTGPRRHAGFARARDSASSRWSSAGRQRRTSRISGERYAALRDFKHRGVNYTFEVGDSFFAPSHGDYQLRNLYTPAVNFAGASFRREPRRKRRSRSWPAKRPPPATSSAPTPKRWIRTLAIGRGAVACQRPRSRSPPRARASSTDDLQRVPLHDRRQRSGRRRRKFALTPSIHLVGDASVVRYRRRGERPSRRCDGSALAGASVLARARMGAGQRVTFLAGRTADPDPAASPIGRRVYAAGEYERLQSRARVRRLGVVPGQSRRECASPTLPPTDGSRGFGGVRVPIGDALERLGEVRGRRPPVHGSSAAVAHARQRHRGRQHASCRRPWDRSPRSPAYARRKNVESESLAGSYTQHEGSGLLFVNVTRDLQLFGSVTGESATSTRSRRREHATGNLAAARRRRSWSAASGSAPRG